MNKSRIKKLLRDIFANNEKKREASDILRNKDSAKEFVRKVSRKLETIPKVGKYLADIPILCLLVKDYVQGAYTSVPFTTMVSIVVALAYFLLPNDFMIDAIPIWGLLDDAMVIKFAINAAHSDIMDYKNSKKIDELL